MAINNWPEDRRPREKLLAKGAASLSDAELLAIFLRTGVKGLSAVDLAEYLIKEFGSVVSLMEAEQTEFVRGHGLGTAKYAQLQAVMELSLRHVSEKLRRTDVLTDTHSVKRYLSIQIKNSAREFFHVLFLDSQNRLIAGETLFAGTLGSASVYPREVLKRVLTLNASSVILAHNHPSGDATPSREDLAVTKRLEEVGRTIGIDVLDHIVMGRGGIISIREES